MTDSNPSNPHHPPTLADKQIDLSGFQLVDMAQNELLKQPKPRTDFADMARQVLALYPEHQAALKLTDEEFNSAAISGHLELAEELVPYSEWLERRAEQLRETRMVHLAEAYKPVLRLYQRVQAAAEFDPQVGYAFAFLAEHFGAGKKKSKKD